MQLRLKRSKPICSKRQHSATHDKPPFNHKRDFIGVIALLLLLLLLAPQQDSHGRDIIFTLSGTLVRQAAVAQTGIGYQTGDVLTVIGGVDSHGPAPVGGAVQSPCKITITASNGFVTGITSINPGTYTTYPSNPVSVLSGPGSGTNGVGARFNLTFGGFQLSSVTLGSAASSGSSGSSSGTGYSIGDILTIPTTVSGVTASPLFVVTGITVSGGVASVNILNPGTFSAFPTGNTTGLPTTATKSDGVTPSGGTGCTLTLGFPATAAVVSTAGGSGTTLAAITGAIVVSAGSNAIATNDPGAWAVRAGAADTATPFHCYGNATAGNFEGFHMSSGAGTIASFLTPYLPLAVQAIGTTTGKGATFYLAPNTNATPLGSYNAGTPGSANLLATGIAGAQVAGGGSGYVASDVGQILTVCQGIGNPTSSTAATSNVAPLAGVTPATLVITSVSGGQVTGVAVASSGTYQTRTPTSTGGGVTAAQAQYVINPALTSPYLTGSAATSAAAKGLMMQNSYYMVSTSLLAGGSGYPISGGGGTGPLTVASTGPNACTTSNDPGAWAIRGGAADSATPLHVYWNGTAGNFLGSHMAGSAGTIASILTPYLPIQAQAIGTGTNATNGYSATFYLAPSTNATPLNSYSYATPASTNLMATGIGGAAVASGGAAYTQADVGKILTVCQGQGAPDFSSAASSTNTAQPGVTPATLQITQVNNGSGTGPITGVAVASSGTYTSVTSTSTGGGITGAQYIVNPALASPYLSNAASTSIGGAVAQGLMLQNSYSIVSTSLVAGGSGYTNTGSASLWQVSSAGGTTNFYNASNDPTGGPIRGSAQGGTTFNLAAATDDGNGQMHCYAGSAGNFQGYHWHAADAVSTPNLPVAVQAVGNTSGYGALFWLTPNTNTNNPTTAYTYASPASVNGGYNTSNTAMTAAGGSPSAPTGVGGVQVCAGGTGYTSADIGQVLTVCQGQAAAVASTGGTSTINSSVTPAKLVITQVSGGAVTGAAVASVGSYPSRTPTSTGTGIFSDANTVYYVNPAIGNSFGFSTTYTTSSGPGVIVSNGYMILGPASTYTLAVAAGGSGYTVSSTLTAVALGGTLAPHGCPLYLTLTTNSGGSVTAAAGASNSTSTYGSLGGTGTSPNSAGISNSYTVLPSIAATTSNTTHTTATGATFYLTPNDATKSAWTSTSPASWSATTTTGIAIATVITGGSGYYPGDVLTVNNVNATGVVTQAQLTVTEVGGSSTNAGPGAVTGVQVTNQGAYTANNPAKCFNVAAANGTGSGCILCWAAVDGMVPTSMDNGGGANSGVIWSGGYAPGDVFTLGSVSSGSMSGTWSPAPIFQVTSYTYNATTPTMSVTLLNTPAWTGGTGPAAGTVFKTVSGHSYMASGAQISYGVGASSTLAATAVGGTLAPGATPLAFSLTVNGAGVITAAGGTNLATVSDTTGTTQYYSALPTIPVTVTGGTGSGATFNLTANSTASSPTGISLATIVGGGTGYSVGDVLTVVSPVGAATTGTAATLQVTAVNGSGAITGINVATAGSYTANNPAMLFTVAPASGGGSGCILSWTSLLCGNPTANNNSGAQNANVFNAGGYSYGDTLIVTTDASGAWASAGGSWINPPILQVTNYTYASTPTMSMTLLNTPTYNGPAPTAGTLFNTASAAGMATGAQVTWTGTGTPTAGNIVPWAGAATGSSVTAYAVGGTIAPGGSPFSCTLNTNASGVVTSVTGATTHSASAGPGILNYYSVLPTIPVSVTGGTGSGATFNLTANDAASSPTGIKIATVVSGGTGYSVGDVLTVVSPVGAATTGTAATLVVTAVSGGVITGINVATAGSYTANNPAMLFTVVPASGSGSGCILSWTALGGGSPIANNDSGTQDGGVVSAGGYSIGDVLTVGTASGWTGSWTVPPLLQVTSYTYAATPSMAVMLINTPSFTGAAPTASMVFSTTSGNSLMASGATIQLSGTLASTPYYVGNVLTETTGTSTLLTGYSPANFVVQTLNGTGVGSVTVGSSTGAYTASPLSAPTSCGQGTASAATGTGCQLSITISPASGCSGVAVVSPGNALPANSGGGTGYNVGDILTVPTGGGITTSPTFNVTAVTPFGSVTAVSVRTPGAFTSIPTGNSTGLNTTATRSNGTTPSSGSGCALILGFPALSASVASGGGGGNGPLVAINGSTGVSGTGTVVTAADPGHCLVRGGAADTNSDTHDYTSNGQLIGYHWHLTNQVITPYLPIQAQAVGLGTNATTGSGALFYLTPSTSQLAATALTVPCTYSSGSNVVTITGGGTTTSLGIAVGQTVVGTNIVINATATNATGSVITSAPPNSTTFTISNTPSGSGTSLVIAAPSNLQASGIGGVQVARGGSGYVAADVGKILSVCQGQGTFSVSGTQANTPAAGVTPATLVITSVSGGAVTGVAVASPGTYVPRTPQVAGNLGNTTLATNMINPALTWPAATQSLGTGLGVMLTICHEMTNNIAFTVAAGGSGYTSGATAVAIGGTTGPAANPLVMTLTTGTGGAVTSITAANATYASGGFPCGANMYSILPTVPVTTTGGNGSGATFNLTCNDAASSPTGIAMATVVNGGTGYSVGDILTVVSPVAGTTGTAATLIVTAVSAGGTIAGINVNSAGSYTALNPATLFTIAPISGGGSGCILAWNSLEVGIPDDANGGGQPDSGIVNGGGYAVGDVVVVTTPATGSWTGGSWIVPPLLQVASYTYGSSPTVSFQLINTPSFSGTGPTASVVFNTAPLGGNAFMGTGATVNLSGLAAPYYAGNILTDSSGSSIGGVAPATFVVQTVSNGSVQTVATGTSAGSYASNLTSLATTVSQGTGTSGGGLGATLNLTVSLAGGTNGANPVTGNNTVANATVALPGGTFSTAATVSLGSSSGISFTPGAYSVVPANITGPSVTASAGSATLNVANTASFSVGMGIADATHAGNIAANSYVVSITPNTSVTISQPAASSLAGDAVTLYPVDSSGAYYFNYAAGSAYRVGSSSPTFYYTFGPSGQAAGATLVPASAPATLSATLSGSQVVLTWTASTSASSYVIYRSTTSGGEGTTPYASPTGTATTFTDAAAAGGTTYYYTIAAVNAAGTSAPSIEATVTTPLSPPALSATASIAQVNLSWTASTGAVSYAIYRGSASGSEGTTPYATVSAPSTSYVDMGGTNGTVYYYTVTASNATSTSAPSNEVSAAPTAPLIVRPVTVPATQTGSLDSTCYQGNAASTTASSGSDGWTPMGTYQNWYSVQLMGGSTYVISMQTTGNSFLSVQDSTGNQVAWNDDASVSTLGSTLASQVIFTPAATGSYVVICSTEAPSTTLAYTLTIPNPNAAVASIAIPYGPTASALGSTSYFGAAAATSSGSPTGGWVNHAQDWYAVSLTANDTYAITMSLTAGTGTVVLSLQDSSGNQVAFATGSNSATITFTPSTSGTYTLICSQESTSITSTPYTLAIPTPRVPAVTTITINAPSVLHPNNGIVMVSVTATSGTPTGTISLTVDNGSAMTLTLSGGSATFTITSPAFGRHILSASYPGTVGFQPATATGSLTVGVPNVKLDRPAGLDVNPAARYPAGDTRERDARVQNGSRRIQGLPAPVRTGPGPFTNPRIVTSRFAFSAFLCVLGALCVSTC